MLYPRDSGDLEFSCQPGVQAVTWIGCSKSEGWQEPDRLAYGRIHKRVGFEVDTRLQWERMAINLPATLRTLSEVGVWPTTWMKLSRLMREAVWRKGDLQTYIAWREGFRSPRDFSEVGRQRLVKSKLLWVPAEEYVVSLPRDAIALLQEFQTRNILPLWPQWCYDGAWCFNCSIEDCCLGYQWDSIDPHGHDWDGESMEGCSLGELKTWVGTRSAANLDAPCHDTHPGVRVPDEWWNAYVGVLKRVLEEVGKHPEIAQKAEVLLWIARNNCPVLLYGRGEEYSTGEWFKYVDALDSPLSPWGPVTERIRDYTEEVAPLLET